jgi:hypothetical protein
VVKEIFGKVRKSEITETESGKHGVITFTVFGGELVTLGYGEESKCDVPPDGSWILASIEGEEMLHLIDFELRRNLQDADSKTWSFLRRFQSLSESTACPRYCP